MEIKNTRLTTMLLSGALVALSGACSGNASVASSPAGERVAVGYATANEREVTMPVSSLTESEIQKANVGHIEQLFQGRVSGVQVTRTGSGEFSVRIRGARSLSGGNEPLIVIDGIPAMSLSRDLARVTPQDVKRIDVLKGAAATMYGSRGANGVIMITTKRGAVGR